MANKAKILKAIEEKRKEIESLEKELKGLNPYVDIDKIARNEKYYYCEVYGSVDSFDFDDDDSDRGIISDCNAFTNEEYANKVAKRELLMRKLDKFAWDNNSHVSDEDWVNGELNKYGITFSHYSKCLVVDNWVFCEVVGQIYFKSREVAEKAISEFKDELLEYFRGE